MTKWEIYCDDSFYGMWAVRDSSDRRLNSPRLFHFVDKMDAVRFFNLLSKANLAENSSGEINNLRSVLAEAKKLGESNALFVLTQAIEDFIK